MLALSETWGRADQPDILDPIPSYKMWHTERTGGAKGGGGLTLIYKDGLTAHQWIPPVPDQLQYISTERQWLLLGRKIAFLHIYVACQSNTNDGFIQWNEDLFHLVTQEALLLRNQGFCCLAMGDFNTRLGAIPGLEGNKVDRNRNAPMFLSFVAQVNLTIINTLPLSKGLFTRFMDGSPGSESLLDYGLIDNDNVGSVSSFVIDEEARYSCGSDHALLECSIKDRSTPRVHWSHTEAVQYNINGTTDYSKYKEGLDEAVESIPLHEFSKLTVKEMLPHISENVNLVAKNKIGIKVQRAKRGRKLPLSIIKTIRTKNLLTKQLTTGRSVMSASQVEDMETQIMQLKTEIRDNIDNIKLQRRRNLRSKVLRGDPTRKKFWRFLKSRIKSAGSITAADNSAGKMVFEQSEIEGAVLDHFTTIFEGQRSPVFCPRGEQPSQVDLAIHDMELILKKDSPTFASKKFEEDVCSPYTFIELERELDNLKDGKASGYDQIANELLKNTGFKFRLYLQTFINKMLVDGSIPEELNIGKCMLVHKVK